MGNFCFLEKNYFFFCIKPRVAEAILLLFSEDDRSSSMYVYVCVLCLQILAQSQICQVCECEHLLVFSWHSEEIELKGEELLESKVGSPTSAVRKAGGKDLPPQFPQGAFPAVGLLLVPQLCNSQSGQSPGPSPV